MLLDRKISHYLYTQKGYVLITAVALLIIYILFTPKLFQNGKPHKSIYITDKVYFDIDIDNKDAGRIVIGLLGSIAPKSVKNFKLLAAGGYNEKDGTLRTYAGSKFHRIIKKFVLQGGDIEKGDGSGSVSIYGGRTFKDTNKIDFYSCGLVGLTNFGEDFGSQFFISLRETAYLATQCILVGKVLEGMDVVKKMEAVEIDYHNNPQVDVVIKGSGVIEVPEYFYVDLYSYGAHCDSIPPGM